MQLHFSFWPNGQLGVVYAELRKGTKTEPMVMPRNTYNATVILGR